MSDIGERTIDVFNKSAGNVTSQAVVALGAAVSIATGDPSFAWLAVPASAVAGSATEEYLGYVRRVWQDRMDKLQEFTDAVGQAANASPAELFTKASAADRRLRELLSFTAKSAASPSSDSWTIKALAHSYVLGSNDDTRIDQMHFLSEIVSDLVGAHMRFLRVVMDQPGYRNHATGVLAPNPGHWTIDHVRHIDPGLGALVPVLATKLEKLGLVSTYQINRDGDRGTIGEFGTRFIECWRPTELGRFCAGLLEELGLLTEPLS